MMATPTPIIGPNSKKEATIGISQIWYIKNGAYGAGILIGDKFNATVKAAKTAAKDIVFEFKGLSP